MNDDQNLRSRFFMNHVMNQYDQSNFWMKSYFLKWNETDINYTIIAFNRGVIVSRIYLMKLNLNFNRFHTKWIWDFSNSTHKTWDSQRAATEFIITHPWKVRFVACGSCRDIVLNCAWWLFVELKCTHPNYLPMD